MNQELVSISVDYLLILRVILALAWGGSFALFLQLNRWGIFLVEERTWITVVVGIGIDLIIAYGGDWWTVVIIISLSSIGIIIRSLHNERIGVHVDPRKYKTIWGIEDAIASSLAVIETLRQLLSGGEMAAAHVASISRTLDKLHKLNDTLISVRRGEYSSGNGK